MTIKYYTKLPIPIKAIQWTGKNRDEILDFVGDDHHYNTDGNSGDFNLIIQTLEGNHRALVGDYIIRGIKGEFYPCKEDIFEETYVEIEMKGDE